MCGGGQRPRLALALDGAGDLQELVNIIIIFNIHLRQGYSHIVSILYKTAKIWK